jgi:formylglycine-generating enzyme required for sulfatase activity
LSAQEAKQQQEDQAKRLGVPVQITNSIGMKLNLIPAGRFLMGSPENEPGHDVDEGPQREVTMSRPFHMGIYEVTVGQFKAFVEATNYQTEAETSGKGSARIDRERKTWVLEDPKTTWRTPGYEQTDQHPVTCVSWNDAVAFCDWLSKKERMTYRLPTEAEWEYACRAGTRTPFHFGAKPTLAHMNYNGSTTDWITEGQGKDQPVRVGSYPANGFGLYDMHGNVWEFCSDWFAADAYKTAPAVDPKGPAAGEKRVNRGGAFHSPATTCRAAYREKSQSPSMRGYNTGFRVVCEVPPPVQGKGQRRDH